MFKNIKETAKGKEKKKEKLDPIDEALDWARTICKTFVLVVLVFTFVGRTARVDGNSMFPTLEDKEMLILRSIGYKPKQGDIIAANCEGLNKVIVKRIVAVGGQTVSIDFRKGKVFVDGEEFLVEGIANVTTLWEGREISEMKVPEGKYFVLGDNRQDSTDSRRDTVGFIDREDILGKAIYRILPFDRIGTL